jgi:hypothetical protein
MNIIHLAENRGHVNNLERFHIHIETKTIIKLMPKIQFGSVSYSM